jgi:hypothetical protein
MLVAGFHAVLTPLKLIARLFAHKPVPEPSQRRFGVCLLAARILALLFGGAVAPTGRFPDEATHERIPRRNRLTDCVCAAVVKLVTGQFQL